MSPKGRWSESDFGREATRGGPEPSSERLQLQGLRGYRPARPLLPSLDVDAHDEEPQAERSFTDERGELDPGDQVGREPWCQDVGEAVDQVGHAVDHQQDTDGSGQEPG